MSQLIFMLFFGALLAACGLNFIDKPIQTIVILIAANVALNLHKITK